MTENGQRPFLVYARRWGWVIADEIRTRPNGSKYLHIRRPKGLNLLDESHVLGRAELPPVPENAA